MKSKDITIFRYLVEDLSALLMFHRRFVASTANRWILIADRKHPVNSQNAKTYVQKPECSPHAAPFPWKGAY